MSAGDGGVPTQEPAKHLVELAIQVSTSSPCRSKRGSVIFDRDDNVVAHGYNFKPRGFDCDGTEACKATCRTEAIHAEQFALLMAGARKSAGCEMLHVKTVDGVLVPSGGPSCVQCSKLGMAAGVAAMWLYHENGWRRYPTAEWHRLSLAALSAGPHRGGVPTQEQVKVLDAAIAEIEKVFYGLDSCDEFPLRRKGVLVYGVLDKEGLRHALALLCESRAAMSAGPATQEPCGLLSGWGPREWYGCVLPKGHTGEHRNHSGYEYAHSPEQSAGPAISRETQTLADTARWVAGLLEVNGYKAFPCAQCQRQTLIAVDDLHGLLLQLAAALDPSAPAMSRPTQA